MDLDDRHGEGQHRVAQGDRRVRVGPGVNDDGGGGLPRLVEPVDELTLVVRLPAVDIQAEFARESRNRSVDVRQRGRAVNLRLALAEEIEVGAIEDEDWLHAGAIA